MPNTWLITETRRQTKNRTTRICIQQGIQQEQTNGLSRKIPKVQKHKKTKQMNTNEQRIKPVHGREKE